MNTQQNDNGLLRQGDVLLVPVKTGIPSTFVEVPREPRGIVLAEGVASRHWHGITSHAVKLFRAPSGARMLRVVEPAKLEQFTAKVDDKDGLHGPIALAPGDYKVGIHAEHMPGELPRSVVD